MRTKEDFHKLIDRIQDETVLKGYYDLVQKLNENQEGVLWNKLKREEKEELLLSFDESFDPDNLISHDQVKSQHSKWFEK